MEPADLSKPAGDLRGIHAVISRGLAVAIERSLLYAQQGFPDEMTAKGFGAYVRTLAATLHGHHLTEDKVAFPFLRGVLPSAPWDQLQEQHVQIASMLPQVESALAEDPAGAAASQRLAALHAVLERVSELWHPHIKIEEGELTPQRAAELIDAQEYAQLAPQLARHSQEHSGRPSLAVPFLLYNLSPEDREIMAQDMPREVVEELVPTVWREQWAPMAPFLLLKGADR